MCQRREAARWVDLARGLLQQGRELNQLQHRLVGLLLMPPDQFEAVKVGERLAVGDVSVRERMERRIQDEEMQGAGARGVSSAPLVVRVPVAVVAGLRSGRTKDARMPRYGQVPHEPAEQRSVRSRAARCQDQRGTFGCLCERLGRPWHP